MNSVAEEEMQLLKQGAEAKVFVGKFVDRPVIIKERFSKGYRHPLLDKSLTSRRIKSEVRSMLRCRTNGIRTPAVYMVDLDSNKIYMEYMKDSVTVRDHIVQVQSNKEIDYTVALKPLAEKIGAVLGDMHDKGIIHGDLTTSNMLLEAPVDKLDLVLIDFGLGYVENVAEDKAVDLYVLERAFLSTHPNTDELFGIILDSYIKTYKAFGGKKKAIEVDEVIRKLDDVRQRGRKRTMVG